MTLLKFPDKDRVEAVGMAMESMAAVLGPSYVNSRVATRARKSIAKNAFRRPDKYINPGQPNFVAVGHHLSFIPDVYYPADMRMVEAIRREFDPTFTPIFRKLVYRSVAGGTYIFKHFGIARMDEGIAAHPLVLAAPRPGNWPATFRPNYVERWLEEPMKPGSYRELLSLPRKFRPWTTEVYAWARATFWAATAEEKWKEMERREEAKDEAKNTAWEKMNAESEWRQKQEAASAVNQHAAEQLDAPHARKEAIGVNLGLVTATPVAYSR